MPRNETVAIIGYGAVGKYLKELFPAAVVYDEPLGLGRREEVNRCDYAFVAVPTNAQSDGSADTSIVEKTVSWLETGLIVLSVAAIKRQHKRIDALLDQARR